MVTVKQCGQLGVGDWAQCHDQDSLMCYLCFMNCDEDLSAATQLGIPSWSLKTSC